MGHDPGSAKHLDKQMKMKGLGRLRWYCTPCAKQCRDENSFKQHTLSEGHVRRIQGIGDVSRVVDEISSEFQSSFIALLSRSHREKSVHANHFYQSYIADRNHVHLNATRWKSLTEFVKHLGRESLCIVEEKDDGFWIAWVDRSPEALRRADALRAKERAESAATLAEEQLLKKQIQRAEARKVEQTPAADPTAELLPEDRGDIKFQLNMGKPLSIGFSAATAPKEKRPNVFKAKKSVFKQASKTATTDRNPLEPVPTTKRSQPLESLASPSGREPKRQKA